MVNYLICLEWGSGDNSLWDTKDQGDEQKMKKREKPSSCKKWRKIF